MTETWVRRDSVRMRVLVSRKTEHFHVAAVRQPAASIGVETSMPSTSPEGPARSASAIELAPVPQPISTTRSPGRSCARVWAELQVLAILRTVGSVCGHYLLNGRSAFSPGLSWSV
jgi:hypothetical protein